MKKMSSPVSYAVVLERRDLGGCTARGTTCSCAPAQQLQGPGACVRREQAAGLRAALSHASARYMRGGRGGCRSVRRRLAFTQQLPVTASPLSQLQPPPRRAVEPNAAAANKEHRTIAVNIKHGGYISHIITKYT
jgi:hypothetical protein